MSFKYIWFDLFLKIILMDDPLEQVVFKNYITIILLLQLLYSIFYY